VRIKERVQELVGRQAVEIVISKQYLIEALIDNLEKALGRRPVKITVDGEAKELFVYEGAVANAALKLAGSELDLFTAKKQVTHKKDRLDDLHGKELAVEFHRVATELLRDYSEHGDDGID
jgi:hypothetical protein